MQTFTGERLPKWLVVLEKSIAPNKSEKYSLGGDKPTYVRTPSCPFGVAFYI